MDIINFILKYWLEILFGIAISFVGYLYQKFKSYYKLITTTRNGVKVLLKDQIVRKYNECKKKGTISLFDKEMINELYNEYRNLGGNGLISDFINEINDIPLLINGGD